MIRRPPRSTRTDTLFPYTTLFRSGPTRERHLQNKVSDGRDKDRHLPGPLFGGPAVLRHRVHGPLALREHGNLSRRGIERSEEHTSELESLMRISYAVFCLKKKKKTKINRSRENTIYIKQNTA